MLLNCHREIRPAFDGGVVGDDHHFAVADAPDPCDNARAGAFVVVEVRGGEGRELEERRARVEQAVDPFPDEELALLFLPPAIFLTATLTRARETCFQFVRKFFVMFGVLLEFGGGCVY